MSRFAVILALALCASGPLQAGGVRQFGAFAGASASGDSAQFVAPVQYATPTQFVPVRARPVIRLAPVAVAADQCHDGYQQFARPVRSFGFFFRR